MSDERRLRNIAASLERGTLLVQRGTEMTRRGQAAEAHIVYREAGDLLRRALISAAGVRDDSARQAVETNLRSVLAQWEAWGLERSGETRGIGLSGFWRLPGLSGLSGLGAKAAPKAPKVPAPIVRDEPGWSLFPPPKPVPPLLKVALGASLALLGMAAVRGRRR